MYLGRYPRADKLISPPPVAIFGWGGPGNIECCEVLLKNLRQIFGVMVLDEVSVRGLPISFVVCV